MRGFLRRGPDYDGGHRCNSARLQIQRMGTSPASHLHEYTARRGYEAAQDLVASVRAPPGTRILHSQ